MAKTAQAPPVTPDVSIVRLHGEACWHCGAVYTKLHPAGEVQTRVAGEVRVWPIVTCRGCAARPGAA